MSPLTVIQDSGKSKNQLSAQSVIAVGAGKGGVGKSTVSVNLALALKEKGYRVGLLDADIYGPSLQQMLPEGMEPANNPENEERLLPAMTFGMPFISVAHFRKDASIVRAPIANQIIDQFLHLVDWGELDYLIVDFPPGTGDIQLSLMQKAPISGALVVTTPQTVAAIDVRKAMQLFQKMHIPLLGVVENMSFLDIGGQRTTPFGSGGGESLSKEFGVPLMEQLPLDPTLSRIGDEGKALYSVADAAPLQDQFTRLASQVEERLKECAVEPLQVRQASVDVLEFFVEGKWRPLSLNRLQNHCPCARCEKGKKVQNEVTLLEFSLVGLYAIKIQFSSGCSQGIYPFSLIKRLLQT